MLLRRPLAAHRVPPLDVADVPGSRSGSAGLGLNSADGPLDRRDMGRLSGTPQHLRRKD